ncbi:hypothetical protein [Gemmobacter sp.]|uniref:hypothetical protein n=1 Tax=Gemmobacter sp. TaxID=1898957 RepID=UPI003A598778
MAAQAQGGLIEIRGRNRVGGLVQQADHVVLDVATPDSPYQVQADCLIARDGARSPLRGILGPGFDGRVF